MTSQTRGRDGPTVKQAVRDLLEAEVAFANAYGLWQHAAPDDEARRRRDLADWERRLDAAMHEVQRAAEQAKRDAE